MGGRGTDPSHDWRVFKTSCRPGLAGVSPVTEPRNGQESGVRITREAIEGGGFESLATFFFMEVVLYEVDGRSAASLLYCRVEFDKVIGHAVPLCVTHFESRIINESRVSLRIIASR